MTVPDNLIAPDEAPAVVPPRLLHSSERIIEAATELFFRRGFSGTTVRDITVACSLTPGALYVHFESKDALLSRIIEHGYRILIGRLDASDALRASDASEQEPALKLQRLVTDFIWYVATHPQLAFVGNRDWKKLNDIERPRALGIRNSVTERFETAIVAGIDAGVFHISQEGLETPKLLAIAMLDLLNGIPEWYSPTGRLTRDQLTEFYCALALRLVGYDGDLQHVSGT